MERCNDLHFHIIWIMEVMRNVMALFLGVHKVNLNKCLSSYQVVKESKREKERDSDRTDKGDKDDKEE